MRGLLGGMEHVEDASERGYRGKEVGVGGSVSYEEITGHGHMKGASLLAMVNMCCTLAAIIPRSLKAGWYKCLITNNNYIYMSFNFTKASVTDQA